MSSRLRIILVISGIIGIAVIIAVLVLRYKDGTAVETNVNLSEEQIAQQKIDAVMQSQYEKILFVERPSGDGAIKKLPLRVSNFLTAETAVVDDELSPYYSNFISSSNTWFSVKDSILRKHTINGSEEISRINYPVTENALRGQVVSLAASADLKYVAWVTESNNSNQIALYDLEANTETVIFNPENINHFSNLTWSPDGTELAFTDSSNNIITITPAGAQIQNPFSIPFTEFNNLSWIETDNLAAVVTSTEEHPAPFNPKVIVFNRQGEIIEEHDVLERAGIPRVLWSPDAKHFLFFDQWKNTFVVYDRFDVVTQRIAVKESGKLIPFGWITGIPSANMPSTIIPVTNSTINVETNQTPTEQFTITAEQWDQYNETSRAVVKQFKADMSTYRFEVTDKGIRVSLALLPGQVNPEASFIQILLQTMTLLPEVPTMSLDVIYNETDHLVANEISTQQVESIVDTFTTEPFSRLFVVNTNNPYGKPRPKIDNPNHTYFGDLLYSRTGDYNPIPVLADLNVTLNENRLLANEEYSLMYPQTWQRKDLAEAVGPPYQVGDLLFYTSETNFASASSWSGFSVTVRTYHIPDGAGMDDWLLVNRNDRTVEDVQLVLQSDMEAKKVITENAYSAEYVLHSGDIIYDINMDHPPALTPEELKALDDLIISFSDHRLFER